MDPEIVAMIQQGVAPSTKIRVVVTFAGDSALQFPELAAAYAANAPPEEIAAICDAYAAVAAESHAAFNALAVALGSSPPRNFWLIDAVAATLPLGAVPTLANVPDAVRVGLDRYRGPSGMLLSDESTVLIGARDANLLLDGLGRPILGTGIRIGIADGGIDLRTNQPTLATAPPCNPCTTPGCAACCYINPNAGGISWPHGAFTKGDVNPATGIPDLVRHRILFARDVGVEMSCGVGWTPAICPSLTVGTAEDINWRCGAHGPLPPPATNQFGHGTSVASIAAGRRYPVTGAGGTFFLGADGVAPDADILFYKIVDDTTFAYGATEAMMTAAVERALGDAARIFNLSYDGFQNPTGPLAVAIDKAAPIGMLVCAAAGNCGVPAGSTPTCGPNAMSDACFTAGVQHDFYNGLIVGATGKWTRSAAAPPGCAFSQVADRVATYSSRGPLTNVAWGTTRTGVNITGPSRDWVPTSFCPGGGIATALIDSSYPVGGVNPGFSFRGGTSMASPHVAGTAALMLQANPDLLAIELRAILLNEADEVIVDRVSDASAGGAAMCGIDDFGFGRVDAMQAVLAAMGGRVKTGTLDAPGMPQDFPLEVPPGHEAEVTLTWDRVDTGSGAVSQVALEVYPVPPGIPPGAQVANLSVLAPKPGDNFRHIRFRSPAGGVHTVRVNPIALIGSEVPFAFAWRTEVGPLEPAPSPPLPPLLAGQSVLTISGVGGPSYPSTGFFDGGGTGDLAVAAGGLVHWWTGQGGTLVGPTATPLSAQPGSPLLRGALGGNVETDLLTAAAGTAYAGLGGTPPFPSTITSTVPGFDPRLHAVVDVFGLAPADLVFLQPSGASTELRAYPGDGTGAYGTDVFLASTLNAAFDLQALVAGDFDGDGDSDLVAMGRNTDMFFPPNPLSAGALVMFRNAAGGSFDDPSVAGTISHFAEFAPQAGVLGFRETLATGDFDGDGNLDVAALSRRMFDPANETRVLVFLGNGAGRFAKVAAVPIWQELTLCPPLPCAVEASSGIDLAAIPLEAAGLPDLAALVEQASASPTRRVRLLTIGNLGLPVRRETLPPVSQIPTPGILHTGENLLGDARPDLVVGGDPGPTGNAAVEVRHVP